MTDKPTRRTAADLAAYDAGCGQRGISHRRENPYNATTDASRHQAFEEGWADTDRELNTAPGVVL